MSNAGPKWWHDGRASKEVDKTLRHLVRDMMKGKLMVRDEYGKLVKVEMDTKGTTVAVVRSFSSTAAR